MLLKSFRLEGKIKSLKIFNLNQIQNFNLSVSIKNGTLDRGKFKW